VNQVLQALMAKGALERDGDAWICDLALLEEEAESAEHGFL
jgi:hypothetical protein